MNKILILTTNGCEACDIAERNVNIAISEAKTEIQVDIKDWREEDRSFIKENKIKDFPTVLYIIDNNIVHKAVGSYPSAVYLRWIDIYFKK